jgi:signal transduction histidine kinase
VGIFDKTQIKKIEADTLTSQELAKDFYRVVKQFLTRIARVVKELFGLSFADQAAEKNTSDSSKSKTNSENNKSGKNKSKKDSK